MNIVDDWKSKNPNLSPYTRDGAKKFAQDTCKSTFTREEVEIELNFMMEVIVEDLKGELQPERIVSLLDELKSTNYFYKYPRFEGLVDSTIEEVEEENE